MLEFLMNHSELLLGILNTLLIAVPSIYSIVTVYKKKGLESALSKAGEEIKLHQDSIEVLIKAIGFKKDENGAIKQNVAKKASRKGVITFLDSKVKELKAKV